MTNAQHTPGPWHNKPDAIQTEDGVEIAFCADVGDYGMTRANSLLIAAAPELLELLEDVERSLTTLGARGQPLKKIRAAIAKAKGE